MKIILRRLFLGMISLVFALISTVAPVSADISPPSGTPATFSADPLPTVQVNNVVWAQTTVGNTVYVVGNFTKARPAGSSPGQNEVTRNRILAYDIRTGNLIPEFNHSLNEEAEAVTASPDGKRLYVGGKFTIADGKAVNRIAAFDISSSSGKLVTSFSAGPTDGVVKALTATNYTLYAGGSFTNVSGGHARNRLAAFTSNGDLHAWNPSANRDVMSMIITPDGSKVVVGGSFDKINNTTFYGLGAVSAASPGSPIASWASASSSFPFRMNDTGNSAGVTSLSTNGNLIFLTAYSYTKAIDRKFEGRAAIKPTDGKLVWMNDCLGDSYSAIPIGDVLYSANHAHDCRRIGGFPHPTTNVRLLAETITTDGVNANVAVEKYWNHAGQPRSKLLNWFPYLKPGIATKQYQAAWTVTGNSQYLSAGGEFTQAGGIQQEGLVRYTIASKAPKKIGPNFNYRYGVLAANYGRADANGNLLIKIRPAYDMDNGVLTYNVFRDNQTTPRFTFTADTRFWSLPDIYKYDSGLPPGSTHNYRVVVTDPFGNRAESYSLTDDNHPGIVYKGANWTNDQARTGEYETGVHHTTNNGSYYEFKFIGTGFEIVGHKAANTGKIAVSIDGGSAATVNTYAPNGIQHQQVQYSRTGMSRGWHTVRVTKVDGAYMVFDGFRIIH